MAPLTTIPCTELKGVGPQTAVRLQKCGISNVQDLLFHFPYRYQDRTHISPIADLRVGDHAVIEGAIIASQVTRARRRMLLCQIQDGSGILKIRFLHFHTGLRQALACGNKVRCFGEVRGRGQQIEMIHPELHCLTTDEPVPVEDALRPVYPSTEGLSQQTLRHLVAQALALLPGLDEYIPPALRARFDLFDLAESLQIIHRPPPDTAVDLLTEGMHPARQRLAFEELLAHHLSLRRVRQQLRCRQALALDKNNALKSQFIQALPFQLTVAQQRVVIEVEADLQAGKPMLRLVQGDVGCGKTVVAAMAALQAACAGAQVTLMAPTELLAAQHYQQFKRWLHPLGIKLSYLAGSVKGKARREILTELADGAIEILIGTHALLQQPVAFNRLGLVIVDEQHRFGVEQRFALWAKGAKAQLFPHLLIMTATPIPRTLHMTVYADLDVSIIDELPEGRQAIDTAIIANTRREAVTARIAEACRQHQQVYWVCTLIEESEVLQCQTAEDTVVVLAENLPGLNVALIHGRMSADEKADVMNRFKQGKIDLLVATTVIEVGVDVPNASLMIIENAERFGLSQLHQLRGRIGRGSTKSYCVLLYQAPLSAIAKARLQVMRESQDGFHIAQQDLKLRGPGKVLGTEQTGGLRLRIADFKRDQQLLSEVKQAADCLLADHAELVGPLIKRWSGSGEKYGTV